MACRAREGRRRARGRRRPTSCGRHRHSCGMPCRIRGNPGFSTNASGAFRRVRGFLLGLLPPTTVRFASRPTSCESCRSALGVPRRVVGRRSRRWPRILSQFRGCRDATRHPPIPGGSGSAPSGLGTGAAAAPGRMRRVRDPPCGLGKRSIACWIDRLPARLRRPRRP